MQRVNKDANFKKLTDARFPTLPYTLQDKLSCDLYELDDSLVEQIKTELAQKDSTILADTLYKPQESFLEKLYKRKLKIQAAQQHRDSILNEIQIQTDKMIGG
jgi:hypothetical protein